MSSTKSVLPDNDTVEQVFKTLETETTALLEHLDLSFLTDYPVFAPNSRGRTQVHEPPELLKGVLHCFYQDIYDPRPMARELQNEDVWRQGVRRLLHHRPAEACYYGYGCCLVTTDNNIPIAAEFTAEKSVDTETARRITQDALAIKKPVTFVGDAEFDILDWHDDLIKAGVVPVAPYNPRNTNDPPDTEYRIQRRIKEHSEPVRVWKKQLDDTYDNRSQVETASMTGEKVRQI